MSRRPPPVAHTIDFDRIVALPRRVISQRDSELWADVLTDKLALPARRGVSRPAVRWTQAAALVELVQCRGACCFLPVGIGKTLIIDAAPVLLDSKRPVAIMSSVLRDKTWKDFEEHDRVWRRSKHPWQLISREELALDKNQDLLQRIRPDYVALEESDEYCNLLKGAPARIGRYRYETWDDPNVVFAAFSGTPERFSIMATWHLLVWCLRDGAPVPLSHTEMLTWAAALDENTRYPSTRPHPGPLGETRKAALAWYAKRLRETPGVVIIDGDSCDQPLTIRTRYAREDPVLNESFKYFTKYNETPGGVAVTDDSARNPLGRWRLNAQIGIGLCSYWDSPPPIEWREAYRAKAKFVRETIAHTRRRKRGPICDTEGQVLRAFPDASPVREWFAVKDTFRGETVVRWLSRSAIDSVRDWLAESSEPGAIWCGSKSFAKALAAELGLPYYGSDGRTANGLQLCRADARNGHIICSWHANKKGFNLQGWARALIVMPPQSAKWLEQVYGRHHRSGQDRPVVIDVLLGSGGTVDAFETSIREASFAKSTISLTQKVLRAEIVRAPLPTITKANAFRWASRTTPLTEYIGDLNDASTSEKTGRRAPSSRQRSQETRPSPIAIRRRANDGQPRSVAESRSVSP